MQGAHNAIFPITLAQLQPPTSGKIADVVKPGYLAFPTQTGMQW
jgi:hypothetical protein